jgi:hypothetical protein
LGQIDDHLDQAAIHPLCNDTGPLPQGPVGVLDVVVLVIPKDRKIPRRQSSQVVAHHVARRTRPACRAAVISRPRPVPESSALFMARARHHSVAEATAVTLSRSGATSSTDCVATDPC